MKLNTAILLERRFKRGFEALVEKLGLPDTLRFIVNLEHGRGDSVKEIKNAWQGKSARQIYQTLQRARNGSRNSTHSAA